ncbi:hypothetical protein [Spirosoma pollinicola]|uniref:Uncharacterized protein n=1 Tax=Spirosoma pollinicola TaxID=2057025 RepID=A0A2K8Z691_9BACT|nr:hypothetical protein [Spirosoma pollinicola]AUD05339.1 hypothetical protein CWM47_27900 [Spirosoma pollinicola]
MPLSTQIKPLAGLIDLKHSSVAKLLLNAWSAEYALRIKPVNPDREYLNLSISCSFPYYAVLFSARAVLAVDGINIANQQQVEKLINQWVKMGKYGQTYSNPFTELFQYRIRSEEHTYHLSAPEAAAIQEKLKSKVHAVSIIHETYIVNRLGDEFYSTIINSLPDYLKNGFVGARATLLLQDD